MKYIVLLVTGGRNYKNRRKVFDTLDELNEKYYIRLLVEGGCPTGADKWARLWVKQGGLLKDADHRSCPAKWKKFGRYAGPLRNSYMLHKYEPDLVVAFPGNKGTADMVRQARVGKVPVLYIK